jgi:hypothetical protein
MVIEELIVRPFMLHIQHDEQATGNTNCQTHDVDKRILLLLEQTAQSDLEIVPKHGRDI